MRKLPSPPKDVLEAMQQLSAYSSWKLVREWLLKQRDDTARASCCQTNDVSVRWMQGQVQTLDEVTHLIDGANLMLDVVKKTGGKSTPPFAV